MGRTSVLQQGRRVLLRRPGLRDRNEFIKLVRASRRLHRPWVYPPEDRAAFEEYLGWNRGSDFEFMLVCRIDDRALVGVYDLSQIFHENFQNAYLGYYGFSPSTGKGYMSEGMGLCLRYAFTGLKLHRVEANIQPANADSIRLVKHWGFRREGFSPRYLKVGGRWRDHEHWALLADEWRRDRRVKGR